MSIFFVLFCFFCWVLSYYGLLEIRPSVKDKNFAPKKTKAVLEKDLKWVKIYGVSLPVKLKVSWKLCYSVEKINVIIWLLAKRNMKLVIKNYWFGWDLTQSDWKVEFEAKKKWFWKIKHVIQVQSRLCCFCKECFQQICYSKWKMALLKKQMIFTTYRILKILYTNASKCSLY